MTHVPWAGTLSSRTGLLNDIITSTCNHGYSFVNHFTFEFIECLESGKWSKVPDVCHRKSNIL